MRSRLIKESLSGLPRTNQHLTPKSRSCLRQCVLSPVVWASLFASLGLSLTIYLGLHRFQYSHRPTTLNQVLSRFTSKPPLVDRTILEKIAGLDLEDETDSESGIDFSIPITIDSPVFPPFFRPPRVTRIPEAQPQAPLDLGMEAQNTDNVPPSCKFLLPLEISEQGLNAHVHLVQLLELARALNRTLVLPNVGKNRVGACRRWRFGVYYDEQALPSGNGSSGVIQQDRFKAWVDSLAVPPSSQLVSVDWTHPKSFPPFAMAGQSNDSLNFYIHHNSDTETMLSSLTRCLNRKFPQLDLIGPFPSLSFLVADHGKQERSVRERYRVLLEKLSGQTLTRAQSGPLTTVGDHSENYDFDRTCISPDVLLVSWNVPLSVFQPYPATITHYSPQLRALAARLVKRLGPYIAVTWDVETSKSDVVLGCVEALRSALNHTLNSHGQLGIRNIWLAGNLSPSDLLHSSEPLCTSAFTEEPFFVSDVKLTGVHQELERMVGEGEEVDDVANNGYAVARKQEVLRDTGVLGILDKLVSMRSTVFVTASRGCGKTRCVPPSHAVEFHRGLANYA